MNDFPGAPKQDDAHAITQRLDALHAVAVPIDPPTTARTAMSAGEVGVLLLKALGLSGRPITAITVRLKAGEAVEVEIHETMREADSRAFVDLMSRFRLEHPPVAVAATPLARETFGAPAATPGTNHRPA